MRLRTDLAVHLRRLKNRIIDLELAGFARTFTQEQELQEMKGRYNAVIRMLNSNLELGASEL